MFCGLIQALLLSSVTALPAWHALPPQLGGLGGSMVFMENNTLDAKREQLNFTLDEMHTAQVEQASHYRMVIMGWGEDSGDNATGAKPFAGEEGKLHAILKRIKQNSPTTTTIAYCGQFENVVPFYDAQYRVITDEQYDGYFMKDDSGKFWLGASAGGQGGRIWDFRNESARHYLADHVAGYFAEADGVDGVFFDEGESLACHYSCQAHNSCKSMPNANPADPTSVTAWHAGALQAWKLAAETMARAGKHAVISSQNSFKQYTPYLYKTNGCPLSEDAAFAVMNSSQLARKGWMRFYEYFASWPVGASEHYAEYCSNQIRNAAHEAQVLGVPFVASGSDYAKGGHAESLQLELAMFLVSRGGPDGPASYFEYNHEEWSKWPRWGDSETSWAEVQELYTKDYGQATGNMVEGPGNSFTREFDKVTVKVDCNRQTSSFAWK